MGYLIVLAMIIYSALAFGNIGAASGYVVPLLIGVITYFMSIYIFYGITWLAYKRSTTLLWTGVASAVIVGYFMSGLDNAWILLTGWGMLFFGGVVAGRLNTTGHRQLNIYIICAVVVGTFLTAQFLPVWSGIIEMAREAVENMLSQGEESFIAMGYSVEAARENVEYARKMMNVMTRLIPASMILSALIQFTAGYLFFLYRLQKHLDEKQRLTPFYLWKVPFGMTPVILITILMRFWGNDTFVLVADNILAVLAVYYCVSGLSLIEYFLKKLNFSKVLRFLFYFMLFFTQLAGLSLTVLLGFIDSFANWRKVGAAQEVN